MRADDEKLSELTALFAQYGVESFLQTTSLLVALLDKDGSLLAWNSAFDSFKTLHPNETHLKSFLSPPSQELFERLHLATLQKRIRTKGGLEFTGEARNDNFMCIFIPMPGQRVLLFAELVSIGIAQYKVQKEDWQGLLNRADAALYQAKNNERNQWVVTRE